MYQTSRVLNDPAIYQVYRLAKGCISHLIISEGEAVVIDAVRHVDRLQNILAENNAQLKYVIDTHLQADHISGGRHLAEHAGCEYFINPIDAEGAGYTHKNLQDGDIFAVGTSRIQVMHSPGHTPGSTSLVLNDKYVFTGDAVMKGSVGRPDLGGMVREWADLLFDTLHERFSKLDDQMIVLPSHASSVIERDNTGCVKLTLGDARKNLLLFKLHDRKEFADQIEKNLLVNPERYQEIRLVNLGKSDPDEDKMKELEMGKNLCGMAERQT